MPFGFIVSNSKKKLKLGDDAIWNSWHTGCSTNHAVKFLPSRTTWSFKINWFLHMHFRLTVEKSNKQKRIRKLYILKMLYTGCSTRGSISLFLSRSTSNFENKWLWYIHFGKTLRKKITRITTLYILKILHVGCFTNETIALRLSQNT